MINAAAIGTLRHVRADQLNSTPALAHLRYGLVSVTAAVATAALTVPTLHQLALPIPMAGVAVLFGMICPLFLRDSTRHGAGGHDHKARWWQTLFLLYGTVCLSWLAGALLSHSVLTAGIGFLAIFFVGLLLQGWGPRAVGAALNALVAYYLGIYLQPSLNHTGLALLLSVVGLAVVVLTCRVVWPIAAPDAASALPSTGSASSSGQTNEARGASALSAARWQEMRASLCWSPALRGMGAAVLAIAVGHSLSPERWCWAVISVFVVFMGTRSPTDALRRGLQRLGGTVAGVMVSGLLIMCIGHSLWFDCLLMALCVAGWAYHILHAYARGVFFITILVALVYAALGFSLTPLLEVRLLEVIAGCLCAFATALIPVPAAWMHGGSKGVAASPVAEKVDLAEALAEATSDEGGIEPSRPGFVPVD
ncbi:FUSC family protein [Robbsia sp. KACC 23696]|uniref:FUSC family protein n=1 Tax=Robbsia sp. KACC 23696 TaxID=3149231 RepID=UPI00325A44F9